MKLTILALSAGVLSGGLALAASEVFTAVDQNSDGGLSIEEVIAMMPSTTPAEFAAADADGDGMLTEVEFSSAMETGLLRTGG